MSRPTAEPAGPALEPRRVTREPDSGWGQAQDIVQPPGELGENADPAFRDSPSHRRLAEVLEDQGGELIEI